MSISIKDYEENDIDHLYLSNQIDNLANHFIKLDRALSDYYKDDKNGTWNLILIIVNSLFRYLQYQYEDPKLLLKIYARFIDDIINCEKELEL